MGLVNPTDIPKLDRVVYEWSLVKLAVAKSLAIRTLKESFRDFDGSGCAWWCELLVTTPKGIRTPVAGMKSRCPRPLDDGGKGGAIEPENYHRATPPSSAECSEPATRGQQNGRGASNPFGVECLERRRVRMGSAPSFLISGQLSYAARLIL